MNVYEMLGRKTADFEALNAQYDQLLLLLSRVLSGEICPERVSVDLANRSWACVAAEVPVPEMAAPSVN